MESSEIQSLEIQSLEEFKKPREEIQEYLNNNDRFFKIKPKPTRNHNKIFDYVAHVKEEYVEGEEGEEGEDDEEDNKYRSHHEFHPLKNKIPPLYEYDEEDY